MKYKKWTLDQKLEILATSEEIGIVEACRKYGVELILVASGAFFSYLQKYLNLMTRQKS
ncbi:hypothetical protein [Aquimarina sp. I32.4]|uniref:hypothetical protein n=1 Tax=Aquimarina sp. I32.4 TaxID=2053903 RepID=UPI0013047FC3|nr:hypothetical protein [Aquimarina sp. I32.4]